MIPNASIVKLKVSAKGEKEERKNILSAGDSLVDRGQLLTGGKHRRDRKTAEKDDERGRLASCGVR